LSVCHYYVAREVKIEVPTTFDIKEEVKTIPTTFEIKEEVEKLEEVEIV
jgi:hypothetical protein